MEKNLEWTKLTAEMIKAGKEATVTQIEFFRQAPGRLGMRIGTRSL